ncbi:hypothetical protein TNCV_349371 [Trichonephila clavipes]|nr:hypothetical protein TNCV_349371 [Trichonephila clavipes]
MYIQTLGLVSNPREGIDYCKYIVPLRHRVTLNSHRVASPLMRLVKMEERLGPLSTSRVFSLEIGVEPSQNVTSTCTVLKAMANDKRKSLALCHNEFRGPRSDTEVLQCEAKVVIAWFQIRIKTSQPSSESQGESLQKCVVWHCPDGTQLLFCWPILVVSGQSLASNGPVVDSRYLNLVFGHVEATPNK